MGGIEGIVNMVTKVQNIMSQFNKVSPMLKMLFKGFGGAKVNAVNGRSPKPRKRKKSVVSRRQVKKSGPAKALPVKARPVKAPPVKTAHAKALPVKGLPPKRRKY
jgi:hypothetical protein